MERNQVKYGKQCNTCKYSYWNSGCKDCDNCGNYDETSDIGCNCMKSADKSKECKYYKEI